MRPAGAGRLQRRLVWLCNLLVFGVLLYWSVVLFDLRLILTPVLQIHSKVAFTVEDFNRFLSWATPLGMWVGGLSLTVQIGTVLVKSVRESRGWWRRLVSLSGSVFAVGAAITMFTISLVDLAEVEHNTLRRLWPVTHRWHDVTRRFTLTSSYGLFRTMTGVGGRPEVILEVSDSMNGPWEELEFLYKPGDVSRRPPVNAPHQPRLDWQMWFAALGSYQQNPWLLNMVYRVLTGQREVLELLGQSRRAERPPRYLRAWLYHYHFTSAEPRNTLYSERSWWQRSRVKEYLPILSKDDSSFVNYLRNAGIIQTRSRERRSSPVNLLSRLLRDLRALIGQPDGARTCWLLLTTALVMSFLEPGVSLKHHRTR